MDKISFAICATQNQYRYLPTIINSLLKHNDTLVKNIYLIIEHDSIDFIKNKKVKFININLIKQFELFDKSNPNLNSHWTYMSTVRLLFPLFIDEDYVFYLDTDTLVTDSFNDLKDLNLSEYYVAAVPENIDEFKQKRRISEVTKPYYNAGVMIMNLKKMREDNLCDKFVTLMNGNTLQFPDQDVLNLACKEKIYTISNEYNMSYPTNKCCLTLPCKILHWAGQTEKGWYLDNPLAWLWYRYYVESI